MHRTEIVVVISGAGRGIGAEIAHRLGRSGARVVVNYRSNRTAAHEVVENIRAAGGQAHAVAGDVTNPRDVATLLTATKNVFGRIDVLVCNANTVSPPLADIESLSWSLFESKVVGELAAAYHLTQQVLPTMREQSCGSIVYISSTSADYVGPGRLAHGTAKAALITFAGHVAAHGAAFGVTVTTIAPGAARTDATAGSLPPDVLKRLADKSILGRATEPEDIANLVATVLDPAMRIAPGSVLRADGGFGLLAGGPAAPR
ncbi:SDR family oxidoreductase [Rhodococcus globerulus]|uniref:3-oxoacyl-[acyl-carrier-protein] reductase MabA n=1 Tax=Rhodococcus globerulus TaxID=33008 RepID=A0ABU4C425_RHOGO|nr:SDR family oxidoreductase [Rhodococcus globerulus]MDV6271259.1 SDR family oxidoreductase [Rhodococcus globerulus]